MVPASRVPSEGAELRDVRRLLRGLNDVDALRRNPLVAHLFDEERDPDNDAAVLTRIRACIDDAAQRLRESGGDEASRGLRHRLHAILKRCDLGRQPWSRVAADLGIRRRQFYVDRLALCRFVREHIDAHLGDRARTTGLRDRDSVALDLAVQLGNLGRFAQALSVYDDLIAATDGERSVPLLARRTILLAEEYRFAEARASREVLRACAATLPRAQNADLECASVDANLAVSMWELQAADVACRRVGSAVAQASERTRRQVELAVDAQLLRALLCATRRDLSGLRRALASMRNLLDRSKGAFPQYEAKCGFLDFALLATTSSSSSRCAAAFTRAEALLRAAGQLRQFVLLDGRYGFMKLAERDVRAARFHAERAALLARTVSPPLELAKQLGRLALAEAIAGDRHAATTVLGEAATLAPRDPTVAGMAALADAELALRERHFTLAVGAAESAVRNFEMAAFWPGMGWAARVGASAAYRVRDIPNARRLARSAVAYDERAGYGFDLVRSYYVSAKITGDREHGARAVELLRSLRE